MPLLRVARRDDVDQLSAVFLDCWRISYAPVMPASLVAGMTAQKARSLWADALQRPNQTILAATGDEPPHTVVGFVGFQLQEDGVGYVSSLYVSPQLQGGGVGRLLLSEAEQELRDAGARTARLWVFEENAPSRAFYARQGWQPDGRRETLPEWGQPQLSLTKTFSD
jgi:ribosomal protein S18 acetylase RimI-like enzyme